MDRLTQFQKQFVLELLARVVGRQDLLLVLLELRSDVPLAVLESLFPNIIRWDSIPVGIGDLYVITEDRGVTDLQTRDPRRLGLIGLVTRNPFLTA